MTTKKKQSAITNQAVDLNESSTIAQIKAEADAIGFTFSAPRLKKRELWDELRTEKARRATSLSSAVYQSKWSTMTVVQLRAAAKTMGVKFERYDRKTQMIETLERHSDKSRSSLFVEEKKSINKSSPPKQRREGALKPSPDESKNLETKRERQMKNTTPSHPEILNAIPDDLLKLTLAYASPGTKAQLARHLITPTAAAASAPREQAKNVAAHTTARLQEIVRAYLRTHCTRDKCVPTKTPPAIANMIRKFVNPTTDVIKETVYERDYSETDGKGVKFHPNPVKLETWSRYRQLLRDCGEPLNFMFEAWKAQTSLDDFIFSASLRVDDERVIDTSLKQITIFMRFTRKTNQQLLVVSVPDQIVDVGREKQEGNLDETRTHSDDDDNTSSNDDDNDDDDDDDKEEKREEKKESEEKKSNRGREQKINSEQGLAHLLKLLSFLPARTSHRYLEKDEKGGVDLSHAKNYEETVRVFTGQVEIYGTEYVVEVLCVILFMYGDSIQIVSDRRKPRNNNMQFWKLFSDATRQVLNRPHFPFTILYPAPPNESDMRKIASMDMQVEIEEKED